MSTQTHYTIKRAADEIRTGWAVFNLKDIRVSLVFIARDQAEQERDIMERGVLEMKFRSWFRLGRVRFNESNLYRGKVVAQGRRHVMIYAGKGQLHLLELYLLLIAEIKPVQGQPLMCELNKGRLQRLQA
ncbi:hypothetical protein [Amantichitinum ursilacus]|uniref:Uncharacterized protein n=1 Tax=Amantichitinum ursilacus TaxID=857265 RepID=A0A0N0XIE9_9NEIS|nr:hypothetical protein [Amantichitinum ursilacus]KPC52771.1 hypothetical protein WG78_13025 [Amantichitinum ursilacus]